MWKWRMCCNEQEKNDFIRSLNDSPFRSLKYLLFFNVHLKCQFFLDIQTRVVYNFLAPNKIPGSPFIYQSVKKLVKKKNLPTEESFLISFSKMATDSSRYGSYPSREKEYSHIGWKMNLCWGEFWLSLSSKARICFKTGFLNDPKLAPTASAVLHDIC